MAFYKFQKDYLTFEFVLKHLFNLKHTCSTLYTIVYSQLIFRPKQKKEQLFTGLSFSFFPNKFTSFSRVQQPTTCICTEMQWIGWKGGEGEMFRNATKETNRLGSKNKNRREKGKSTKRRWKCKSAMETPFEAKHDIVELFLFFWSLLRWKKIFSVQQKEVLFLDKSKMLLIKAIKLVSLPLKISF